MTIKAPLVIGLVAACLTACLTGGKKNAGQIDDFSLGGPPKGRGLAPSAPSIQGIRQGTSLPLPIRVGKSTPSFDGIPKLALDSYKSKLYLKIQDCILALETGPIVIDQYLWTNQWVKFQMALVAKQDVILEPGQYGSFRANMDLYVTIPTVMLPICRKFLAGKKIFLGTVHYNKSRFFIINGPGSPKVSFNKRSDDSPPVNLYLNWPVVALQPQLLDQFDLPTNQSTPIQRALFAGPGRYYMSVAPVLSFKPGAAWIQPLP